MLRLREKGTRAWFLSQDNQLRRALVSLQRGHYAGFVMPPATLAQHLTELHWGEVDLSGFSALMWTLPRSSQKDRAVDMILRAVLEKTGTRDVRPDWLRDQVEGIIKEGDFGTVIPAAPDGDSLAEQEMSFLSTMREILPKAVEKILDTMASLPK